MNHSKFIDDYFLQHEDPAHPLFAWVVALGAIDKSGDKSTLIKLLMSTDYVMPFEVREFIADLLDRHELTKSKTGRPRTPIYERSLVEAMMLIGIQRIRENQADGQKF
jgi:hypothetical protein